MDDPQEDPLLHGFREIQLPPRATMRACAGATVDSAARAPVASRLT
jgi:hypothetical protein